ncbi:MAG TPA: hypothetical protein VFI41_05325 [Gemmatimonadales bacterium]|nr:hypothetical protein [Gemmatimonadales bacterium]
MPDSYTNGPSITEIARRLQRVEDRMDERTATVDQLRAVEAHCVDRIVASEKVQEAREIAHAAALQAQEARVAKLESSNSKLTFMVIAAFLTLLISFITQVLQVTGGRH